MSETISSSDISGLRDESPPFGAHLSGVYKRSFAYTTIKDRLPVIVTRIIDNLSRNKESITKKHEASSDELKAVISKLSELRNEIMTNKQLSLLEFSGTKDDKDIEKWNNCLNDKPIFWFNTEWLLCECYMYRRIAQIFRLTDKLATFDPFADQKKDSFFGSMNTMIPLAEHMNNLINSSNDSPDTLQSNFIKLFKLNLWGNRCDLSLSAGSVVTAESNPIEHLAIYDGNILVDDSLPVWELINKLRKESQDERVVTAFVIDNAGYELFTDLCLAVFLTHFKLVRAIRFYVKSLPWFISDTTLNDFHWTIDSMKTNANDDMKKFGEICSNYVDNGTWTVEVESFWTEPFDYSQMKSKSPDLYEKLSDCGLIVFKGDLNYRKLLGDINWEYETDFKTALRGFLPTNLVALRTIKADLIAGISSAKASELCEKQANWMESGEYGLIQSAFRDQ